MSPLILEGQCFKGNPLKCTLVLQWEADYDHPCLIVTNLRPQAVQPQIYSIRYWIECGFKDIKRALLHWEQTKMTDSQRAERLWLVISIALLWLTAVGEAAHPLIPAFSRRHSSACTDSLSAPVRGWITLILTLLRGHPLPYGSFNAYPWVPPPDE